jgi:hypothetical protein
MTKKLSLSKIKTFRILFENVSGRGKIGWTTITGCTDQENALDHFRENFSFSEYEIVQIAEISD